MNKKLDVNKLREGDWLVYIGKDKERKFDLYPGSILIKLADRPLADFFVAYVLTEKEVYGSIFPALKNSRYTVNYALATKEQIDLHIKRYKKEYIKMKHREVEEAI